MTDFKGQIKEKERTISLDLYDRKILYLLSKNARYNNVSLGKAIGKSREFVHYRLERLQKEGFLNGYSALLNYDRMDQKIFLLFLNLRGAVDESSVRESLESVPQIQRLLHIHGRWNLLCILALESNREFNNVLHQIKERIPSIADYNLLSQAMERYTGLDLLLAKKHRDTISLDYTNRSSFSAEFSKKDTSLQLDTVDYQILSILSTHARIALNDISRQVGMSIPGVTYRIKKLIRNDIIQDFIPYVHLSMLGFQWHIVLMKVAYPEIDKVLAYARKHELITWYQELIGTWQVALNIFTPNNYTFNELLGDIRSVLRDGLEDYETVGVLAQEKFVTNLTTN